LAPRVEFQAGESMRLQSLISRKVGLVIMMREKTDAFRILLEFEEPKAD